MGFGASKIAAQPPAEGPTAAADISSVPKHARPGSTVSGSSSTSTTTSVTVGRVVVIAIDANEHTNYAFDYFVERIWKKDDLIVLVHSPEPPNLPTFNIRSGIAPPVHEWKKVIEEMNARVRKLEEDYEGTCVQKKLRYKVRGEASKNPGELICRVAHEEGAELIVVGTRGLGAVKRALKSSVSEYVSRNSGLPTLVVPFKKKAQTKS